MNDQIISSSSIFMRVLLCKIHCPSFICFCKPSVVAAHLYNPGPLKLENTPPHLPPSTTTTTAAVAAIDTPHDAVDDDDDDAAANGDGQFSGKSTESSNEDGGGDQEDQTAAALKSCLRKVVSPESGNPEGDEEAAGKKKVRWMDNLGKQLVEIKEFESSDRDSDNEMENRTCICTIL